MFYHLWLSDGPSDYAVHVHKCMRSDTCVKVRIVDLTAVALQLYGSAWLPSTSVMGALDIRAKQLQCFSNVRDRRKCLSGVPGDFAYFYTQFMSHSSAKPRLWPAQGTTRWAASLTSLSFAARPSACKVRARAILKRLAVR